MDQMLRAEVSAPTREGFRPVTLALPDGEVRARWYAAEGSERGVAYVGGAGDRWDTPAGELYPRLAAELTGSGLHGLRLRFRAVTSLDECVEDLLAGIAFLRQQGVRAIGLVGHSMGGAVAIQAGSATPETRTVVTLATQSYGAYPQHLPAGCSLLLMHGDRDGVLPPTSSRHVFEFAHEPKRLIIVPGAGHVLDEAAQTVYAEVGAWLMRELAG